MASLKERKEQFVSGLGGGTVSEVYGVVSLAITCYLNYELIATSSEGEMGFLYDFILNGVPILCSVTSYSGDYRRLHWMVLVPGVLFALASRWTSARTQKQKRSTREPELLPRKSFLTVYRSYMLILTNISILAVDFPIFPRRFAKVETWGTSMMDLGVGSFVFSMGLVHSRSIIRKQIATKVEATAGGFHHYIKLVRANSVKSLPILVLGLVRLASVKTIGYQEHTTEYGVHWNFFITLGFLPVFLAILDPLFAIFPRLVVAFLLISAYEVAFQKTALLEFILRNDNRFDSLLTMNKEGIFSFIGYLSIFIFGQSFGSFVLTGYPTPRNLFSVNGQVRAAAARGTSGLTTVSSVKGLVIATVFYQVAFWYSRESFFFTGISRRLANFAYVMWVVSFNAFFLLGFSLVDAWVPSVKSSPLLDAVNNNGLFVFLVANLSTGLVNMTMDTLQASSFTAFLVLLAYSVFFCGVSYYLDKKKIYIKL